MREKYLWTLPLNTIELGERTALMGILNVTPDSFSDAGEYFDTRSAIERGQAIEAEGADILDIGGESTRPGSQAVSEEEEIRRVIPVIEALAPALPIPISVDTYRAAVASRAIEAGAQIVNDISGLRFDKGMAPLVRETRAGLVLVHSRGERETLHQQPPQDDGVSPVIEGLVRSIETATAAGIESRAVIIDPGIGFGKSTRGNLKILKSLEVFSKLGYPMMVGTSRKSFIRTTSQDSPEARAWRTAATVAAAILKGAHIVRVHDVRQMRFVSETIDRILLV